MIEEPEQLRTALNWDVALQIERAVTEFEMAWRKGNPNEIEWVLQQNPTVPARELFCALLETELELRRLNGDTPDPNRWTGRFPQWSDETEYILAQCLPGESVAEDPASPLPHVGEEFGRYRIVREVGRGAMGVVFQAEIIGDVAPRLAFDAAAGANQTSDARAASMNASRGTTSPTVAIKVIRLHRSLTEDERRAAARRFFIEASATAALKHPNVIPVHEVGDVDGIPYFTMPLIEGGTLKGLRREAPLDPVRAARIIEAAACALHHAHRAGLFHRDIKPSNILLGPGDRVFVTDFGVSLHRDELGRGPGLAGTPLYMSPEQSAGKSDLIDGRSDVFSLGIVLYELLTGAHPFDSPLAASAEIIERICHLPVPPLRQRSDIPRPLEDICLKALRRLPEDRYSTAADFADDLRAFVESADDSQLAATRPVRRRYIPWAIAIGMLAAIGIIVGQLGREARPISGPRPLGSFASPTTTDPDRAAAEWLLTLKPTAGIAALIQSPDLAVQKLVTPGDQLLDETFHVVSIRAWSVAELTDQDIARWIVPLRSLRSLQIDFCVGITDAAVPIIKRSTMLSELGLSLTQIRGPACLKLFEELPGLTSVNISNDQMTDEMADYFRSSPKITSVTLHNGGDAQLRQLMLAKQLTGLGFYTPFSVDTATWRELPDQLPNLERVGASTSNFSVADLTEIARCPNLRQLWLKDNPLTDTNLLALRSCQKLRSLDVKRTKVSESGVRILHKHLPQCRIEWDGGVIEATNLANPSQPVAAQTEFDGQSVEQLLDRLLVETNSDIRTALLLTLGERNAVELTDDQFSRLQPLLVDWYENSPSPVLHSAIEWLTRRWEREASQSDATNEKSRSLTDALRARRLVLEQKRAPREGGWYQPMHGPTMVVVPGPVMFTIPRTFAVATTEITEQQFHDAHETHWLQPKPSHPDDPRANASWQEAAWFCNRLSELEGIPPVKQCYEQFIDDKDEKRLREKANALDLPGYRLPTAEEWEYVRCRTSSKLPLKPNDFGLFDSQNKTLTGSAGQTARLTHSLEAKTDSSETTAGEPPAATKIGLRVARTIPPVQTVPQRLVAVFAGQASHPDDQQVVAASDTAKAPTNESEAEFVPFDENEIVCLGAWPRGRVRARRFRITNLTDQPVIVTKTYLGGLFKISEPPPMMLAPNASAEFSVAVDDTAAGARSGDLVLWFKSGDRESAHFGKVSGNVHGIVMNVFEGGISGRDRSAMGFGFGTVPLNAHVFHGFGVYCQGDETLRIHSIEVPDGFVVEPGWESAVEPGKIGGFRVQVDTTKLGDYSGRIRLRSNDPVEPVFEFPVHARVSDSKRFSVIGVFRAGLWLFDHNRDGKADEEISFGRAGDKPVTGDVNNDGICDIGVCRPTSDGKLSWEFYHRHVKEQPPPRIYTFGKASDVPFLSDPIGDGLTRPTVVGPDHDQRELVWQFDIDGDGEENKEHSYLFGEAKATPIVGDWNGDGISDAGQVIVGDAGSNYQRRWRLRLGKDRGNDATILFGSIHSIPAVGDWDADGRSQVGLFELIDRRMNRYEWRLDAQSGSLPRLEVPFGRNGDIPVVLAGDSSKHESATSTKPK